MAPLGATAFGWIGESFSFYLDDSPFVDDMQKEFRKVEIGQERNS